MPRAHDAQPAAPLPPPPPTSPTPRDPPGPQAQRHRGGEALRRAHHPRHRQRALPAGHAAAVQRGRQRGAPRGRGARARGGPRARRGFGGRGSGRRPPPLGNEPGNRPRRAAAAVRAATPGAPMLGRSFPVPAARGPCPALERHPRPIAAPPPGPAPVSGPPGRPPHRRADQRQRGAGVWGGAAAGAVHALRPAGAGWGVGWGGRASGRARRLAMHCRLARAASPPVPAKRRLGLRPRCCSTRFTPCARRVPHRPASTRRRRSSSRPPRAQIGAGAAWFVRALMAVCAPLSWPIGKLLDCVLGGEHTVGGGLGGRVAGRRDGAGGQAWTETITWGRGQCPAVRWPPRGPEPAVAPRRALSPRPPPLPRPARRCSAAPSSRPWWAFTPRARAWAAT
jgi:hypothetical protein